MLQSGLRWLAGYLGLALVLCGMVHCGGGGLIAVFWYFFATVGGVFILAGGWALGYHSMGFGHFANVSQVPGVLSLTSFGKSSGRNNRPSFHLWWKENQSVSKYFENNCRLVSSLFILKIYLEYVVHLCICYGIYNHCFTFFLEAKIAMFLKNTTPRN